MNNNALPKILDKLSLPAIAAPMFIVSNPDMVIATCKSGMIGSFPALNQRDNAGFEAWLSNIQSALGEADAPFAVNLIVHKSNTRLEADLATIVKHKVPIVITSLGINNEVIDAIHSYGGLVFHDVVMSKHAKKAADNGVDGLILVCAGAGGHAGQLNPFAFVGEVRSFFDGLIILSGCISTGGDVAAARAMGADLAYMGTRFIATNEARAKEVYKHMVVASKTADIVYTPNVSGVPASFLSPSLVENGLDVATMKKPDHIDLGLELKLDDEYMPTGEKIAGAWKDLWSAGQGVGAVHDILPVATLIDRLKEEYATAHARLI